MSQSTIKILSLCQGGTTAFDGQYLVEYDPGRNGVEPGTGFPMFAHIVTTPDISEATKYDGVEALEVWRAVDPRQPVRSDGKPNRPLTAFHVEIETVDE